MKLTDQDKLKFDGFMNYQSDNDPSCTTTFTWRNTLAEYNYETKELTMIFDNINLVDWNEHPGDAVAFLSWLGLCKDHSSGLIDRYPPSTSFY